MMDEADEEKNPYKEQNNEFVKKCTEAIMSIKNKNFKGMKNKFSEESHVKKELLSFFNVSISIILFLSIVVVVKTLELFYYYYYTRVIW